MSYKDFMNKVRYWDNRLAKWFMKHFYFMFFQIVLVGIFVFWFINIFNIIDTSMQVSSNDLLLRIEKAQSINLAILVFLILLNSFWLLFIFNSMQRLKTILRDISFYTSHLRQRRKNPMP